jgi:hypothetical protein
MKYLILLLFLTGCITVANYKNPRPPIDLQKNRTQKSLTFRVGYFRQSSEVSNLYQLKSMDSKEESVLLNGLRTNGLFSNVEPGFIPSGAYKGQTQEGMERLLEPSSYNPKTDIQINLYLVGDIPGDNWMIIPIAAYGLVHVASLGLIPFWGQRIWSVRGDFRNSRGQVIYKFEKQCKASFWSWTPLLLTKWDWSTKLWYNFGNQCVSSILADAQDNGAM